MKIVILGSSGMAGHILFDYLIEKSDFEIVAVAPRTKVNDSDIVLDIFNRDQLSEFIYTTQPDMLINCLGILVKASEENKADAVWVNSYLPHYLAKICTNIGAKLIHLSTDCVFNGSNGPYTEDTGMDADDFYGKTKGIGEIVDLQHLTIRTSIIGPELRQQATGLFHWFMQQSLTVNGFGNVYWSGVTTLELAKALQKIISNHHLFCGRVQLSVDGGISKFDLLNLLNHEFSRNLVVNKQMQPIIDKRLVPSNIVSSLDVLSYSEQIMEMKIWMESHSEKYQHYLEQK